MTKLLLPTRVLLLLGLSTALASLADAAVAGSTFHEGFESYAVGSFPSDSGWTLRFAGAGTQYQHVDDTHAMSGGKSLRLVGSGCWAAEADRALAIPDSSLNVLEVGVLVDATVACGCTEAVAHVSFANPNLGSWGTHYGQVLFTCDGYISACTGTYPLQLVKLMPYEVGTWYHVGVVANLRSRTFSVYIDGVLQGAEFPIGDDGNPTMIQVTSGHGGTAPVVWFDEVLAEIDATVPTQSTSWGRIKALYR
jgi:hypothetical protein